jgi:two-component sensor histidine kinase
MLFATGMGVRFLWGENGLGADRAISLGYVIMELFSNGIVVVCGGA